MRWMKDVPAVSKDLCKHVGKSFLIDVDVAFLLQLLNYLPTGLQVIRVAGR